MTFLVHRYLPRNTLSKVQQYYGATRRRRTAPKSTRNDYITTGRSSSRGDTIF